MAFEWWRGFVRAWRDYPLPEGTGIGERYKIEALLGQGSYGLTYRCWDTKDGAFVAVKQSRPSKKAVGRVLLIKEGDVLRSMDHPNIPKCRDYFEYKGSNWLVTDYIEGKTLEDLIFDEHIVYGERKCLATTLKLMELVAHVHARGYVHLDLRIPNVILKGEEMYLIDFGLARRIGENETVFDERKPATGSSRNRCRRLSPRTCMTSDNSCCSCCIPVTSLNREKRNGTGARNWICRPGCCIFFPGYLETGNPILIQLRLSARRRFCMRACVEILTQRRLQPKAERRLVIRAGMVKQGSA
ncbi:protein kinase [Paenibacillus sonchi]|uniref:Protein kinase n=1 Tax=Paenibacillus sonchi TaxID=373687 RepID=A0A974P923_9BACL|nr:protein kinase [Paenibacillus sonchi]QQZ59033.1 protein kinase [Paenibacillus sonchi]